jgi:hypothetical protein
MINIHKGTNRARCKICKEVIDKEEISIEFSGYRISKQYHFTCLQNEVRNFLNNDYNEELKKIK